MSQSLANGLVPTAPPASGAAMAAEINKGFADARSMLRGPARPGFIGLGDLWVWSNNGSGGEEIRMNRGGAVDFRLMLIDSTTGEITIPGHLKASEFTSTAVRDLLKLVDGAGSGVDADLLRGTANYLRNDIPATMSEILFIARPFDEQLRIGHAVNGVNPYISFYRDGSRIAFIQTLSGLLRISAQSGAYLDLYQSGDVRVNNGLVWHSLNDGAGSGLDADLLDGLDGTQYLKSAEYDRMQARIDFDDEVNFRRPSSEQSRFGYATGVTNDNYVGFYRGGTTREGFVRARSGFMQIAKENGATIDLHGVNDARLNGWGILTSGNLGLALAQQQDGDVGTFALAHVTGTTTFGNGATVSGSLLRPSHSGDVGGSFTYSGTWRCMGRISASDRTTLFLRIA